MALPLKVDDITADWLSEALSIRTPGTRVAGLKVSKVIPGTTTKMLLRVDYAEHPGSNGPPTTLCLKGGFDDALRVLVGDAYIAEANFFNHVAPQLDVPLPRCWYAEADNERRQGLILLDDLVAAEATFGDPTEPWPIDRVAAGLEVQARWHAQTWGWNPVRFPWLHVGSWIRNPLKTLLGEANWQRAFSSTDVAQRIPAGLHDRALVERAFHTMWRLDDQAGIPCMIHSDPHIGNTYITRDGQPGFLDWQSASLAPAMDDASYFLVGALTVPDRRAHEKHLLSHYLEVLGAQLGQKQDFDQAWLDYRRHAMHGFIWAVVPPDMQQPACVTAMTDRYVAAIEDLDTLRALDS